MIKKVLLLLLLCGQGIQAEIRQTIHIEEVLPFIDAHTLVLVDIDDTLIDSAFTLGNGAWRNAIKPLVKGRYSKNHFSYFDLLTYWIARSVPVKAVEKTSASFIDRLQQQGVAVLALTSRGRSAWYSSTIAGIDGLTDTQLKSVGIDFSKTALPPPFQHIDPCYFYKGILFTSHLEKGELLTLLFDQMGYRPEKVVFIDDKRDQVEGVEKALTALQIPFVGFWYKRAEVERSHFDPWVGHLQMEHLFLKGCLIDDAQAALLPHIMICSDLYFKSLLNKISFDDLEPAAAS